MAASASASAPQMDPATIVAYWNILDSAIFKVQLYFAALCGIVFYEWLANLRREYRLIWKSDWTLVKLAYILIRYMGIAHAVIDLYAYWGQWHTDDCRRFVTFIPAFPIFGVMMSHFIMLTQCHAVWNRELWVLFILIPLMLSETVIMSISSFTKIGALPLMSENGPCLPQALSSFCILYFASPMVFDLTVTVLTAIKTMRLRKNDEGIGAGSVILNTIIHGSFQYFIFITVANLINIVYYAVDVNNALSSINGPLAIIATELFSCRLTLSLREVKQQQDSNRFATGHEKSRRHFVKVVVFGDVRDEDNELSTLPPTFQQPTNKVPYRPSSTPDV